MARWGIAWRFGRCAQWGALLVVCAALGGCAAGSKYSERMYRDGDPIPKGGGTYKVGKAYRLNGKTYSPSENPHYRAEGIASWYGPDFHGRLTANGEIYDMRAISAAHPTMPLPSYARVTNLDNGRSIVVRVNDRGPYARGRLIDVSIGTAKALDFYKRGLAHVRVEYVGRAPIEGSDDRQLMATLRQGHPAPAPQEVRLAALNPLRPLLRAVRESDDDEAEPGSEAPLPSEQPRPPATTSAIRKTMATVKIVRSVPAPAPEPYDRGYGSSAPTAAFAPVRNDANLGLMSGRGLY